MSASIIERLREVEESLEGAQRDAVHDAIERMESMSEQLDAFKKSMASRFRSKSEKVDPGQLTLAVLEFMSEANVGTAEQPKPADVAREESRAPQRIKRRSGVRLLPVKKVDVPVSDKDRLCSCGRVMATMGHDVRRQIVHTPARLHMLEERLEKCACGTCKNGVQTATGTTKPIEGGLASSSLLAHIAVRKCVDAVPVERTGRILARDGADIPSSTLHSWFGFVADQAGLIAPIAQKLLLQSRLISLDDTTLLSKKHDDRPGTQHGRLWMYVGDVDQIVVCRFSPDWKGTHPQGVLEGFSGTVQLDGYGGLNPMFKGRGDLQRVGCNDHCRRHFVQALRDGDKRAAPILEIYRRLYEVEAEARARQFTPMERLKIRKERSQALWHELGRAIESIDGHVSKKSALGKGVRYWDKQNAFLRAYLDDGFVPSSNIHVERLIRTIALFRKNSLFVGNTDAGERFADLMTLMLNCALCGANPYDYLCDILTRLADGWPAARKAELLPQAWLAAKKGLEQPAAA